MALYPSQAPTAADILHTPEQTLRQAGLSRSKVSYVRDLAAKVQSGLPTLEQLATQDDDAIIQTLTQVKGIGRWSAQMLLIFRLQRQDVWPTDDQGIRNALQRLYQLEEPPSKAETERCGQPWQPYRSIAAWYLWRSLAMADWG